MKKKCIWKAISYLSIFGILLALYLFYNYLTKPAIETCYVNSVVNCDAVTKGALKTIFGIPVSLVGLVGYIVILLSSLKKWLKLSLFMTSFGMVFCLFITYQELFKFKVLCPVCLTCQLVMLIVFILSIKLNLKKET